MSKKLSVAFIGAGNIAGGFDEGSLNAEAIYSHAGAYTKQGGFKLQAVFDADNIRAKKFADYWGVEYIAENEDVICSNYYDIISICSPDRYHFDTLVKILKNENCKIVFVEKPLGMNIDEVKEIYRLSLSSKTKVVVNFQRHFDNVYKKLNLVSKKILAVNCYYIKGLNHIGITMIDTVVMLFGIPKKVLTYNRILNAQINDYTYEFVFFYDDFNITFKTVDCVEKYNYHIFDIDILTECGRYQITDNGNSLLNSTITNYSYGGVSVLDSNRERQETEYKISMLKCVDYITKLIIEDETHTINTVSNSLLNHLIIEQVIKSYNSKRELILNLEETLWKK